MEVFDCKKGRYVEVDENGKETKKVKIAVYFSNDRRAVFEEEEIAIYGEGMIPTVKEIIKHGDVAINWNNVCYIKQVIEEEEK